MSDLQVISSACYRVRLSCVEHLAAYLSELLWTIPNVLAVQENYDLSLPPGQEVVESLDIFVGTPETFQQIKTCFAADASLTAAVGEWAWMSEFPETIQESDWAEAWKQFWHVTPVTETLTICPSWEPYQPRKPNERLIVLDPGCAFGTGTHETTQLMLEAMAGLARQRPFETLSVLDVGTGSGILAIDAAQQGCRSVVGIDIDPLAVDAAKRNAAQNGVEAVISFSDTPLESLCRTPFDLILANLIAPVIETLLPEMLLRLTPDGTLVLSGLVEQNMDKLLPVLDQAGVTVSQRLEKGAWLALMTHKK